MTQLSAPKLSQNETAMLACLLAGLKTDRICQILNKPPVFVRLVFKALLYKTATPDRHHLVRWGRAHGYTPYPAVYIDFIDKRGER